MTLLEAVVATVLLALVAVAALDGTGQAARLQHQSVRTTGTVAAAEAALEQARLMLPPSPATRVTRRPYTRLGNDAPGLDLLSVEVADAEGRPMLLARLVPRAPALPQAALRPPAGGPP